MSMKNNIYISVIKSLFYILETNTKQTSKTKLSKEMIWL